MNTKQAAEFLNVSEGYIIKVFGSGSIQKEVLEKCKQESFEALQELIAISEEMGLYD